MTVTDSRVHLHTLRQGWTYEHYAVVYERFSLPVYAPRVVNLVRNFPCLL